MCTLKTVHDSLDSLKKSYRLQKENKLEPIFGTAGKVMQEMSMQHNKFGKFNKQKETADHERQWKIAEKVKIKPMRLTLEEVGLAPCGQQIKLEAPKYRGKRAAPNVHARKSMEFRRRLEEQSLESHEYINTDLKPNIRYLYNTSD